ncbi:DUF924 domain-containing protein [Primorskyibacter aestuariivivens]|uniref:DUF924 family protein n=1 Tax=Primorskyibacter aestuariivivens TaxID=1888912 RepID=UPI0023013949|nr:DUF924 family protein [Primorskyibacter aestuariivivens]MDA7427789.1 DUF924 domain-containing protein [Primorskyibacter aestuariivivens]
MSQIPAEDALPEDVLAFWFPDGLEHKGQDAHMAFWQSRMQGGMDEAIIKTMADVTAAAARGQYDHWADTAHGRLALLIALDQFPRSLWRDTPAAFGQDIKSNLLVLEGIKNGHFDALKWPWEKNFYLIALCHCEGPDHLARIDLAIELAEKVVETIDGPLREGYADMAMQPRRVREVIERFARHPHRNAFYGRLSTPDEAAYVEHGEFPHNRKIDA